MTGVLKADMELLDGMRICWARIGPASPAERKRLGIPDALTPEELAELWGRTA